jgi:hypothetical protein
MIRHVKLLLLMLLFGIAGSRSLAEAPKLTHAPSSIQSALLVKLLAMNKALSQGGNVTVLVLGSHDVAMAMKTGVGMSIGASKLTDVAVITEVPIKPPQGPTAFYVGDPNKVAECTDYCRKHKIQTMTGLPDLVGKGVTIIVGIHNKKPKILIDLENAKKEGIEFDPAILKIATEI